MPKTKGAHVINAVKILRAQRARALELLPPRLHHYLDERIMASSWYPMEEQFELLRAIATMLPGPDPWLVMGRGTARADFTGIYKIHLREGDPARSFEVMPVLWRTTNDTGEVSVSIDGPSEATLRLRGYDFASVERCRMVGGYLSELLTMASAKDPVIHHDECTSRGAVECVWSASWS